MIQLIALDLDGTLLNNDKQISKENQLAIQYAQEKGVKVVICTGRPYSTVKHLLDQLALNHSGQYVVLYNGAQIMELGHQQAIFEASLGIQDLNHWQAVCQALELPLDLVDSQWVYRPTTYPAQYPSLYVGKVSKALTKSIDYADFSADHRFMKFVISADQDHIERQWDLLPEQLKADYNLTWSYDFQLEIMKKGIDKGKALQQLAQRLAISTDQMMGVGDQMNDLAMLQAVGVAVAMGNASPDLKELADFVTLSNEDHGVAHAIYHYLKEV